MNIVRLNPKCNVNSSRFMVTTVELSILYTTSRLDGRITTNAADVAV